YAISRLDEALEDTELKTPPGLLLRLEGLHSYLGEVVGRVLDRLAMEDPQPQNCEVVVHEVPPAEAVVSLATAAPTASSAENSGPVQVQKDEVALISNGNARTTRLTIIDVPPGQSDAEG